MNQGLKNNVVSSIEKKIGEADINHPTLLDQNQNIVNVFQVRFIPAIYLFDQQHLLRFYQGGKIRYQLLKGKLDKLI